MTIECSVVVEFATPVRHAGYRLAGWHPSRSPVSFAWERDSQVQPPECVHRGRLTRPHNRGQVPRRWVEAFVIVDQSERPFPAVAGVAQRHEADSPETVAVPPDSQRLEQNPDQRILSPARPAVVLEVHPVHNRSPVGPTESVYSHNPGPSTAQRIRCKGLAVSGIPVARMIDPDTLGAPAWRIHRPACMDHPVGRRRNC